MSNSNNTSTIVLHVDNEKGQVVKVELEDASTGERTAINGNFEDIKFSQSSSKSHMDWRMGETAPIV